MKRSIVAGRRDPVTYTVTMTIKTPERSSRPGILGDALLKLIEVPGKIEVTEMSVQPEDSLVETMVR